jgi:hypothetical protein
MDKFVEYHRTHSVIARKGKIVAFSEETKIKPHHSESNFIWMHRGKTTHRGGYAMDTKAT